MRIIVLALALFLGGCATDSNLQKAWTFATVGVENPITREHLYVAENSLILAVAAAQSYKRACAQRLIDDRCRTVVAKLQSYTRPAAKALPRLRVFVRANNQINARVVYTELMGYITDFKSTAAAEGVPQ